MLIQNWEVTSDSITLYLAHKLKLKECYLIKDVDGIIVNDKGKEKIIREMNTSDYLILKNSNMMKIKMSDANKFKKS